MKRAWAVIKKLGLFGAAFWAGCFYGSIVAANAEQAKVMLKAVLP